MILGVNLGYHSKKLYQLINDQYTVRSDEAFRFAVGSFIENVRFVLVYRQTKANVYYIYFHDFDAIGLLFHDFDIIGSVITWIRWFK
jgi:hypothetical protein